jgi:transposase-like protein
LVAEQGASGQSVAAFCPERGLPTSQFYTWRKRLRSPFAEQFLEVQVARQAARPIPPKQDTIEIHLAEGRWLRVEPGFDPEHLQTVLAVLEARA